MKKFGFGAISLLLTLIIITIIFFVCLNTIKGISSIHNKNNNIETKNVQEYVNQTVNDIEQIRHKSINTENRIMQDEL